MRWIDAGKRKPEVDKEFGESGYVTCLEKGGHPFSGWWNETMHQWFSADRDAPTIHRRVVLWKPMMKLPEGY